MPRMIASGNHQRPPLHILSAWTVWTVLMLLTFAILWNGGKTIPATWLAAGTGVLCIGSLVSRLLRKRAAENPCRMQSPALWILLLALIGWTGLSYGTSSTQNYGLDEVLRTAAMGFIFLWVLHVNGETDEKKNFISRFLRLFFRLLIISCIIGIAVYLFQPVNRFVGTFFDERFHTDYWPNACADLLLLGWPIVLLVSMTRMKQKASALFPLGLLFGCLLLTYSRGALIALSGQLFLLLVVSIQRSWKNHISILLLIVAALLLGACLFAGINALRAPLHPVQDIGEKITFSADEGISSVSERSQFWKQSLILMDERPLLGWGPYSFRFVQPRLQTSVLATSDHPHNVFLKIGMESGIPAMVLFILIVIICLSSGIVHTIRRNPLPGIDDRTLLGYPLCTVAIAGLLAHNLIDYNLQFVGIALPFWILLAIISQKDRKAAAGKKPTDTVLILLTVLLASSVLFVAVREGVFLITSSFGRHAEARGESAMALSWYEYSHGEWFTRDMELSMARLYNGRQEYASASAILSEYLARNEQDARAWTILAETHRDLYGLPGTLEAFEKAFTLGGWNDAGIARNIFETLQEMALQKDPMAAGARTELAKWMPIIADRAETFASAIEHNLHYIALSPNPEEVAKILISLAILNPDKADHYNAVKQAIMEHASLERERIRSRPPGLLW